MSWHLEKILVSNPNHSQYKLTLFSLVGWNRFLIETLLYNDQNIYHSQGGSSFVVYHNISIFLVNNHRPCWQNYWQCKTSKRKTRAWYRFSETRHTFWATFFWLWKQRPRRKKESWISSVSLYKNLPLTKLMDFLIVLLIIIESG